MGMDWHQDSVQCAVSGIGELTQCSGSFEWGERGIIVSLSALVFPYIFLLVDCFEWALIGNIGQRRVDSVLWQF